MLREISYFYPPKKMISPLLPQLAIFQVSNVCTPCRIWFSHFLHRPNVLLHSISGNLLWSYLGFLVKRMACCNYQWTHSYWMSIDSFLKMLLLRRLTPQEIDFPSRSTVRACHRRIWTYIPLSPFSLLPYIVQSTCSDFEALDFY